MRLSKEWNWEEIQNQTGILIYGTENDILTMHILPTIRKLDQENQIMTHLDFPNPVGLNDYMYKGDLYNIYVDDQMYVAPLANITNIGSTSFQVYREITEGYDRDLMSWRDFFVRTFLDYYNVINSLTGINRKFKVLRSDVNKNTKHGRK